MTEDFPAACKAFLSAHISSVADLQVILLLHAHRDRLWTAAEVGQRLATNNEMAVFQLQKFRDHGLLVSSSDSSNNTFQFNPSSPFDSAITQLGELYNERPVRVIAEIYAGPMDKARTFADSFRLRKDK